MMRRKELRRTVLHYAVVIAIGVVMAYPLIGSWRAPQRRRDLSIYHLIDSEEVHTGELQVGWAYGSVSFGVYFRNSFIIAGLGTIGTVLSSLLVAYGFSIKFAGQRFWFICMLNSHVAIPSADDPQYIMFRKLNWINTFLPLIVPSSQTRSSSFIMQFVRGSCRLDESAEIDGANKLGTLWWIILPLVKPALITSAIFSFYWKWDDFLGPLLYLNKPTLHTVSLALRNFADPSAVQLGCSLCHVCPLLIPVMVIFIAFRNTSLGDQHDRDPWIRAESKRPRRIRGPGTTTSQ